MRVSERVLTLSHSRPARKAARPLVRRLAALAGAAALAWPSCREAVAAEPVAPALERISRNTPAALAAMPAEFERDWQAADPRQRLSAMRTLAVYAVFERAALELAMPHLEAGLALAREAGDDGTLGLLTFLQGIAAFLTLPPQEGATRRDQLMAEADALSKKAADPTLRCLGLYLQGRARKHAVAEAVWMQSFLDALAVKDAAATCRSWVVAELNGANGQRIAPGNLALVTAALSQIDEALAATPAERFPTLAGRLLIARGTVHERAGQLQQVEAPVRQALELARGIGDRSLQIAALDRLEYLYVALDRPRDVLALLKEGAPLQDPGSTMDQALRSLRAAEMHARLSPPEAPQALAALRSAQQILAGRPEDRLTRRAAQVASYVYERTGDLPAALAQARLLHEITQRQIAEGHTRQLADLQVQFDVKTRALENERLRVSVDALTERRNLLITGLVLTALGLAALGVLLRRQVLQKRQVAHLYGQLERLNQSRSEFLAAACHDLRQPAHSLSLLAEVASGPRPPEPRLLEDIRRNTVLLGDMLTSLLDLTQLERGDMQVHEGPVSVDALFDEAARQFDPIARRKGLSLDVQHSGLWVRSDAQLLRRIVFNLVSNACKYTDRGSIRLTATPCDGSQVRIDVADTGHGIPQERIADMMRPYTRLDHGAKEQGLGIGLSVVQRATQRLGHRLDITSAVGRGTTVSVTLAACAADTVPEVQPGAEPMHRARLALLEDNAEVRNALAALLAQWDLEVVPAGSGDELLQRLDGRRPDLLLADHDIGSETGLDVLQRLRARPGWDALPAVLITGSVSAQVEERARSLGVALVLKPARPAQLRRAVGAALKPAEAGRAGVADPMAQPGTAKLPSA